MFYSFIMATFLIRLDASLLNWRMSNLNKTFFAVNWRMLFSVSLSNNLKLLALFFFSWSNTLWIFVFSDKNLTKHQGFFTLPSIVSPDFVKNDKIVFGLHILFPLIQNQLWTFVLLIKKWQNIQDHLLSQYLNSMDLNFIRTQNLEWIVQRKSC